jgi:DNA-binding transcriptional ArsR family regulator
MSPKDRRSEGGGAHGWAPVFAALGDEGRLLLVRRLAGGQTCSIAELTEGSRLTRQAIRKHLGVLERAGLVRGVRAGREHRFALEREAIEESRRYLERVSEEWDAALGRLKAFVEV